MLITQGYASASIAGFNFLNKYHLTPYVSEYEPLIVFGCYRKQDIRVIREHKGILILKWCGNDSKLVNIHNKDFFSRENIIHITSLPKIAEKLQEFGIHCKRTKIATWDAGIHPIPKGRSIYTYLNKNNIKYLGGDIVDELRDSYKNIIVGDYSIPQKEWEAGVCNEFYSQSYIGLCLSNYAGGGYSVVEMGLRGIKVVTNVIDLPNSIPWTNIEDIKKAINNESDNIGRADKLLAQKVWDALSHPEGIGFDLTTELILGESI